jgi:pimeloyl-ACP methyl ester carboxylesterase
VQPRAARDERVEAAIAHWAPRFTSQGVDGNDFRAVTEPIERWEEWLPAWVANGDMHAALAREAETLGRTRSAGEAWVRAALSYHFAKFVWIVDLDLHRQAEDRAIAAVGEAHRLLDPSAERVEIPFDGFTMAGNLRLPNISDKLSQGRGTPPLVLLLPGLDSTKEEFFHWEQVFLDRGLATFSLDGPGQGETGVHSHIRPDYERAVSAALDALDGFDRIGVAGVSLGGYYAPRAAAYEKRIEAAVGISGPFNFGDCWETMPGPTREAVAHHTGASTLAEAQAKAAELDLADAAPLIDQPLLLITGKLDRLIPWQQTEKIARAAPNATWVLYEEGNHVCNNIPYKYRPLTADWLRERLS